MDNNAAVSLASAGSCHNSLPVEGSAPAYQGYSVTAKDSGHRSQVPAVRETTDDVSLAARLTVPAGDGQSRTVESQSASTAADAGCGAAASTEATANRFLCQIDGEARTFESMPHLIAEPQLLRIFRRNFSSYFADEVAPIHDYELRSLVITRDEMKAAFLLCNNVEQTTQTSFYGRPGNHVETLFNPLMDDVQERLFSIVEHSACDESEMFKRLPRQIQNALKLSEAGFYLSLAQHKLICFSCGGAFDRWNEQWQDYGVREVHARIFPSCRYVRQRFGASFITHCRQKVAPGPENDGPRPLVTYPHLYRKPVTEEELHAEFKLRAQLKTVHLEKRRMIPNFYQLSAGPEVGSLMAINLQLIECCERLDQCLGDQLVHDSLSKLHSKVWLARVGGLGMITTMLQILQDLLAMPGARLPALATEVAQIIDAVFEGDCQDHTAEVLDQITTRMAFVSIQQQMDDEDSSLTVLDLLEQLKRLFNESVLYQLLTKNSMDGVPLIAHRESVEIRAFLKNEFARTVCDFHSNTIHQVHPRIGAQSEAKMLELTESFKEGISNREHFKNYLLKLFKTDTSFVNFLKLHDEEFATMLGTSESSAELLMELYSSSNSSEQEVLTNTTNLAATREEFLAQDLECFLGKYVRHYWETIVNATSR